MPGTGTARPSSGRPGLQDGVARLDLNAADPEGRGTPRRSRSPFPGVSRTCRRTDTPRPMTWLRRSHIVTGIAVLLALDVMLQVRRRVESGEARRLREECRANHARCRAAVRRRLPLGRHALGKGHLYPRRPEPAGLCTASWTSSPRCRTGTAVRMPPRTPRRRPPCPDCRPEVRPPSALVVHTVAPALLVLPVPRRTASRTCPGRSPGASGRPGNRMLACQRRLHRPGRLAQFRGRMAHRVVGSGWSARQARSRGRSRPGPRLRLARLHWPARLEPCPITVEQRPVHSAWAVSMPVRPAAASPNTDSTS